MKHLTALLNELKERTFTISNTNKGELIQQTQRNKLKAELLAALRADIEEVYKYVFQSDEGILIEIENQSIADNLENDEGSGAITACLDIKIKNLDCNAEVESADFEQKQREKIEKKQAAAKKKSAKIERDRQTRTSKEK